MSAYASGARWNDLSRATAILVVAIGAAALFSWLFGAAADRPFAPEYGVMKANGAVAFVLLGLALLLLPGETATPAQRRRDGLAAILAWLVLAFALVTALEHALRIDLGLDEILAADPSAGHRGRPSPGTAFLFTFSSLSVALVATRRPNAHGIAQVCAGATVLVGMLALITHAFTASPQRTVPYLSTSPHSALAFVLVGLAVLLARPSSMPMAVLLRELPSARLARVLILGVVLILPALGWMWLEGERRGLFSDEFGNALMVGSSIGVLALFIWVGASQANEAEAHLERLRRLYAALGRTNQTITRFHERGELLEKVCRAAVEEGGFRFAWIAWTDPEGARFEAAAQAAVPAGFTETSIRAFEESTPLRELVRSRLAFGIPVFIHDVETDPLASARRAALASVGVRSVAIVPILVTRRLVALLVVYSGESGVFHKEEQELLVEMGNDVGFALEHLEHGERHRLAVAELGQTQSRLASILTSLNSGVWSVDAATRAITYVNPAFERIFGVTLAELRRDPALRFRDVHPDDRERVARSFYDLLENEGYAAFEYRLQKRSGEVRWIDDRGWTAREPDGAIRFDGIAADISDDRRKQDEIRRLNETLERRVAERTTQLERANRELDAFSYSVSHDLRAPLRAIEGFSALLAERLASRLDAEEQRFLDRIRRGVERMSALIEGMLQLARLSTQPLSRVRVDLSAIAREVADEVQRESPQRRVAWSIADGITVVGDAALLRAAIQNLLGNAWKFTGRVAQARIEMGTEPADGGEAIYVRDNGAGFDMAFSDRLFDAFHRMHGERDFPGTGIGLATVKRIVSRHGGRVWADARPGAGATFHFTLGAGPEGNAL